MIFSSIPFLFRFLPIVLAVYYIAPDKLKNAWLFLSSMAFYAWGEPRFALIMLFAIIQGFVFGILIERSKETWAKLYLMLSAVLSLGMLAVCKYADFFIYNFNTLTGLSLPLLKIALPIGISFYTFQLLSYIVDVYRGSVPAQHNFIDLAAYISMFPQLIAGPIVRYADIAESLKSRTHSLENCAIGLRRFVLGLGKKVLIANTLGELCAVFKASGDKSLLFFWIYAMAYTLHIYFDFSGYSDMAIGLGRMFGFKFMENFDHPYASRSVTEFWRRWHISLGSWFRDYVYIPLGGNRVSRARWLRNLLIVWFCTGFWHGAAWNFIVWGLFFGVLLIVEKLWLGRYIAKTRIVCHLYTMLAVVLSFVVFDAADMKSAWEYITALFGAGGYSLCNAETLYYLRSYAVLLLAAIIGALPIMQNTVTYIRKSTAGERAVNVLEPVFLLLVFAVSTAYLVDGSFNPFLYFRF